MWITWSQTLWAATAPNCPSVAWKPSSPKWSEVRETMKFMVNKCKLTLLWTPAWPSSCFSLKEGIVFVPAIVPHLDNLMSSNRMLPSLIFYYYFSSPLLLVKVSSIRSHKSSHLINAGNLRCAELTERSVDYLLLAFLCLLQWTKKLQITTAAFLCGQSTPVQLLPGHFSWWKSWICFLLLVTILLVPIHLCRCALNGRFITSRWKITNQLPEPVHSASNP